MLLLRASMIAVFDGGMTDAAWPVAETPANSNPANPIAIADFGIASSVGFRFRHAIPAPQ
jgi:hypothetical protein